MNLNSSAYNNFGYATKSALRFQFKLSCFVFFCVVLQWYERSGAWMPNQPGFSDELRSSVSRTSSSTSSYYWWPWWTASPSLSSAPETALLCWCSALPLLIFFAVAHSATNHQVVPFLALPL